MHSSISSSNTIVEPFASEQRVERRRLDGFTILLFGVILATLGLAEGIAIVAFDRTSQVQRRELAQRQVLLAVKDLGTASQPHIAVLGNSLLLDGTNVPLLAGKIAPRFVPVPYFVLGTEYFDWYYGLKRLFAEGVRPHYILLGLSPNQFASFYTRGNYSARYLFQPSDLLEVARRTHMDPTTASGFLLSHVSKFYGTRDITHGFIMNRLLPSVTELLHNFQSANRPPALDPPELTRLGRDRLKELDLLCRQNGSTIILVVPPTYEKGAETMAEVGREQHIAVLVPLRYEELDSRSYQSDGYHLNEIGAQAFTSRLAEALLTQLSD